MKKNPVYAPTEGGMEMKRNRVYGLRNPANRQFESEIETDANLLYGLRQGEKFESEICTEANLLYGLRQVPKETDEGKYKEGKEVAEVGDEEEGYVNEGMDK